MIHIVSITFAFEMNENVECKSEVADIYNGSGN